jgi:2-hydroxychromene-2-carboxylate isomerase
MTTAVGHTKESLTEETGMNLQDAIRAGAFGVPTFVLETGELFWGQDRLPILRHRLLARGPHK